VEDLLDLSRMEAGKMRVERRPEDLAEIVREVAGAMEGLLEEKGLELRLNLPSDLPLVIGDRERIRQVLVNLLHNSMKFTPRGGVIYMGLEGTDQGDVLLQVADNGQGIPPRDLERIFDKFYQVDSSSTRQQPGAGLGLPICRKLVEAMGGRIWAESDGRTGSVFKVVLPSADRQYPETERDVRESFHIIPEL
jgi:signal transduction histidine kinase